ncbi:dockerin type I domain-containing protein, partial [Dehalococcoidia bacterium]|nr:dockerin type I domain-containing protein [Dehalococcoidia bacterium]
SYGIKASGASSPIISNNRIQDNSSYGVYNSDSSVVVNAENNWWGCGSGPLDESDDRNTGGLYNPDGKGDRVSNYVDYKPWEGMSIPPNQPSNVWPGDETTGIDLTPTLQSSAFSDPDAGDSHVASHWQLTTTPGDYTSPIFDSGRDTENLESITIPSGTLKYLTTYYWRVRHQDNRGVWSEWSAETSFTTMRLPADVSGDGQVDAVDLATVAAAFNSPVGGANWNEDADLNQDGIVDIFDLVKVGRNFSAGQEK